MLTLSTFLYRDFKGLVSSPSTLFPVLKSSRLETLQEWGSRAPWRGEEEAEGQWPVMEVVGSVLWDPCCDQLVFPVEIVLLSMLSSFLFNYFMKLLRWGHVIDLDYFMKLLRWGHVIEKDFLALKGLEQFMHMSYAWRSRWLFIYSPECSFVHSDFIRL
jgi:hypothetical protein